MVVPKVNQTKEKLLKMISAKDKLEARITEYGAVLEGNGNVGLHGSLVDTEGFPRNDIDVYQVRQARQQIICLQNDHKELMKQIEKLMHQLHSEAAAEEQNDLTNKAAGMQLQAEANSVDIAPVELSRALEPIVKVNLVSPGSPAEEAGLCLGDQIVEFGTINSRNFENNLNQIGTVVHHMQNQRIALKVLRETQMLDLILIPKTWSGRGLLGCNIILLDSVER